MHEISSDQHAGADGQTGLRSLVARYETPSAAAGAFQIATSIGLYLGICAAMYWSIHISYFLTLLLAFPAAGLLVRVFIVQHDCGHGAFLRSRRANDLVGLLCSVLTFTPYANWRRHHNGHHANWNNLDRRESGTDIYSACLTVEEYRVLSPRRRFVYRTMRNPIIAHLLIPPLVFLFLYRVPFDTPKGWTRERRSVYWTDLAILALLVSLGFLVGFQNVLLVQLPVIALTAILGVWMFSLQHRFEDVVWARQDDWNVTTAALQGSSYLKLPRLLQWFTGNIGFHHIHHLSPRVPNYRLQACHSAIPALHAAKSLSWRDGFDAIRLGLWDEGRQQMVRFADAGRRAASRNAGPAQQMAG